MKSSERFGNVNQPLIQLALELSAQVDQLSFTDPVAYVYNPLHYAIGGHAAYLERFGRGKKRVVFLGMNPGPWGMVQTGVPFGEIPAVRDWMKIEARIDKPAREHPKRPVEGFSCQRSEVSGRRLWGYFAERFGQAEHFFEEHLVLNYCPLVFMEKGGRNITPDKLPAREAKPLYQACDHHLVKALQILEPEWVVGVGGFAEGRLLDVVEDLPNRPRLARILHPSPASPAANRDWAGTVAKQLKTAGVWD
jgi:single-strand selective monofunctional uracil DNA glycosylase